MKEIEKDDNIDRMTILVKNLHNFQKAAIFWY